VTVGIDYYLCQQNFADEDEDDEYRPVRQRIRVHEPLTSSPIAATSYHDDEPEEDEEEEDTTDFLNVQGNSIPEWVARDEVRRFIQRKFRHFLETFSSREDENRPDYREVVDNMVAANRCSLELNYNHWLNTRPELAIWLADAPQALLEIMEEGALQFVHKHHPNYNKIHEKIHLRITHLPLEDKIRNIRHDTSCTPSFLLWNIVMHVCWPSQGFRLTLTFVECQQSFKDLIILNPKHADHEDRVKASVSFTESYCRCHAGCPGTLCGTGRYIWTLC
jgi:hypothetical protein